MCVDLGVCVYKGARRAKRVDTETDKQGTKETRRQTSRPLRRHEDRQGDHQVDAETDKQNAKETQRLSRTLPSIHENNQDGQVARQVDGL